MASKGWNWDLNPGRLAPGPMLLIVEFRFIFSSVCVCVCMVGTGKEQARGGNEAR